MLSSNRVVVLAITFSVLLCSVTVTATPIETPAPSYHGLGQRQADRDTHPDVSIDNTGKMRKVYHPSNFPLSVITLT